MRTFLIVASLLFCWPARAEETPQYLEVARNLVSEVSPENNLYQHNGWVLWKGDKSAFGEVTATEVKTDCSGLLDAIFERTASQVMNAFRFKNWKGYPKAGNYYDEISSGNGFERKDNIRNVKAGDVFAAKYTGEANTGHVMIVDAEPTLIRDAVTPLVADTQQWAVAIIDSSNAHWKGDTRYTEDGKKQTGIGRGTIRIYTKLSGELVGWAWSMGPASKYRAKDLLAIGKPIVD